MPRRSRSRTPQPVVDYTELRSSVTTWFQDLFTDVDPKTGYLVKHPTGFYGSKVRSLVRYVYEQSPEVKAIRASQEIRASSVCVYVLQVFKFLSEYILPALFSFLSAYLYYTSTEPFTFVPEFNQTTVSNGTDSWFPSASEAGAWLGDTVHATLSVPVSFLANTLDRTLHLQEGASLIQTNSQKLFYTPVIAVGVYIGSFVCLKCLLNMNSLWTAQWALWKAQGLFLKETEDAIERAVVGLVRPYLVGYYEQLLFQTQLGQSSLLQGLCQTYANDLELLKETTYERATAYIKTIPFAELLVLGNISKRYLEGIHLLIRHSDEQLSTILFQLNQEISRIPVSVKRQLTIGL